MPRKMIKTSDITHFWTAALQLGIIVIVLWAMSLHSYVLFHITSEIVSVIFAVAIFLVAWNARRYWSNNYYILIGFGFLFVGVIDLFHAFEYKGLGIIHQGGDANVATQLWLAGRFLMALSFLGAAFFHERKIKALTIFAVFGLITAFFFLSIFYWKIFPVAYVDGVGLTPFKKISEYGIIALFLFAFALFYRMRQKFHERIFSLILLVLLLMSLTELSFTLYVGVYDFFNLLGHLLKIITYYIAYLAIVEFGLMKPYRSIFKDLKDNEIALRRASKEWNLMFNSISDPAFILGLDHKVTCVNKAMCDFAKLSEGELVGKKCFEFMHKQSSPWKTCPMKTTCHSKKPHTEEIYEPTFGKTLSVTTSPILDDKDEIIGILHIAKDVTEKKEMERAKDEFISLASHQLRTPLSSISLASELLLRGAGGDIDPTQKEMLDEIHSSTKRMSALIGHMLNVSRVELGTLEFNPESIEITGHIETITNEMESQIAKKNLVLKKEFDNGLSKIKFDQNMLRIIVDNLLTNAIRYTESGGMITVSLKKDDSCVVLGVCDTGCGIPKNEQSRIFQKSFRAKNAKQISSDGHGLGLYMVKEVVDKTGAKISFISRENKGTTFFVSFPFENKSV